MRPTCTVIPWDSSSSARRPSTTDGSSTASIEDINEILSVRPTKPTFIVIKDMFYASKTLCDKHVGALYDRCGGKDDTNLQSLLGRACGYGKSGRTIVFTSLLTVSNYLKFWRDIATAPVLRGEDAKTLSGKMAGVISEGSALGVASSRAMPVVKKADAPAPLPKAVDADKGHRVFATQEEAAAFAKTTLHQTFRHRSSEASKEMQVDGKNPSVEEVMHRMQGLHDEHPARMVPTIDGKWCVYWRPSLVAKRAEAPAKKAPAKKAPAKKASAEKSHRVFATQEEAIAFAKDTLKKRFNRRAPKEGEEVSVAEAGKKGLNETNYAKMTPVTGGKWCIHWIPSFLPA
jgi:hypothetical protein